MFSLYIICIDVRIRYCSAVDYYICLYDEYETYHYNYLPFCYLACVVVVDAESVVSGPRQKPP